MSGRTWEVASRDLAHHLRRPLFWFLVLIVGFFVAMLATGHAQIGSGDARVGGTKAWINSEFANSQLLVLLMATMHVFFISVGAGMSLIHDDELKVGELLHSTRLTVREYVWGKFLAVFLAFAAVLLVQVGLQVFFNHAVPHGTNAEYLGPLRWGAYLRPLLLFGLPSLLLYTGACFAIGGLTRQPVLVFSLPIIVLVLGIGFLWEWSPEWLSPAVNRLLQFVDLTGLRWLKENYLNVDRGVDFYNHAPVKPDLLFLVQRLIAAAVGLGAVALTTGAVAARLRGKRVTAAEAARAVTRPAAPAASPEPAGLGALAMRSARPSWMASVGHVAAAEMKLLGRHPGLYLFVPLILVQVLAGVVQVGAFDTPLLQTPGTLAAGDMNTLTLLVCMLILFYTTESLQREASAGFGSIAWSTPVDTGALLLGKSLANAVLGAAILVAAMLGSAVVLAIQHTVPFAIGPFAVMWGLLLLPTFLLWTAFVAATYAVSGNRMVTYTVGLAAMSLTGWFQMRGKMNWVGNWDLWSATRWTDIAPFQLDAVPLALNRVFALGLAAFFVVVALRAFARRERDATRNLQRLAPGALGRSAVAMLPWAILPLAAGIALALQVSQGWESGAMRKKAHDYWRKNSLTWRDVPLPSIVNADVDLRLAPAARGITSKGTYTMVNRTPGPLAAIPVTQGLEWRDVSWTKDGKPAKPEDRAGLEVFHLDPPLAVGDSIRLGWSFEATVPRGTSRNGGGRMEFILPSSIVLTSFSGTNLAPYLGWAPDVGIEEEKNAQDPQEYARDFWKGDTPAGLPMAESWLGTHLRVTAPADLQVNATGVCVSDVVRGKERVTEWRSDHPVRIWNLVAGHWKVKRGDGVAVYYDPRHPYNVDEMLQALEGARRWYGEWFAPFPWRDLRLSEFAGLAGYAQGSPGNITFSETIGFLTRSKPEANAAFWVTAHESAHQWWPNMAMMGRGPGGDVLSEGMAHFSTILLTEQVKGLEQRIAFCRNIEERYARSRRADSERPLLEINGELPGDSRIIYDKGGFALWMLFQQMGRERGLAAQRDYLQRYRDSRDHAVLHDYLAVMREHAADTTAFDAFARQWFESVVVPQYQFSDADVKRDGDGWIVRATLKNVGTGRMPIEVAATRGARFPHGQAKPPAWRDARTTVTLAAGEQRQVVLRCAFAPEHLVVDPDARVLMLERKKADVPLRAPGAPAKS